MRPPVPSPTSSAPATAGAPSASRPFLDRLSALTRFALQAGFWLVVALAFATQIYALDIMPFGSALVLALLDWAPWIVLAPLVVSLAARFPINPQTWKRSLPVHLALCPLLLLLMGATATWLIPHREVFLESSPADLSEPEAGSSVIRFRAPDSFVGRSFASSRVAFPVYWMIVAATQAMAQYRRGQERERRALLAEAGLAEARLHALQGQLNPHFLFNTLNTIAQLVYENPKSAETMILSLGDLLRAALDAGRRREVALRDEIAFVRHYTGIQKVRFSERLDVRYEIEPSALDAAVPTLLLQPLVENAILHGMGAGATPITVFVRARAVAGRLLIEVADSGASAPTAGPGAPLLFKEGVGLGNTRARLAALYGDTHELAIERAAEGGVAVRIAIPVRAASA